MTWLTGFALFTVLYLFNATQITNAERATIGRWFEAGARR